MADDTIDILAETENYSLWRGADTDGEMMYHLEMNMVTVHFFREELDELISLVRAAQPHVAAG